jgi:hypothetical protein
MIIRGEPRAGYANRARDWKATIASSHLSHAARCKARPTANVSARQLHASRSAARVYRSASCIVSQPKMLMSWCTVAPFSAARAALASGLLPMCSASSAQLKRPRRARTPLSAARGDYALRSSLRAHSSDDRAQRSRFLDATGGRKAGRSSHHSTTRLAAFVQSTGLGRSPGPGLCRHQPSTRGAAQGGST